MRFSILIPSAGNWELIGAAANSVRGQTFQDFEVVIVDLTGANAEKLKALGDRRIRYCKAPEGGPFTTWDYAAKQARGEYMLWLDDDNLLFPYALALFDRAIRRSRADIVTASHLYYYDAKHPRHHLRNSIGVIPFTGETREFSPREAIRALFALERRGPGQPFPRFHFSATAISRRVIRAAIDRLGYVLFTDGLGIHSLQPILFSFAQSGFFVDHPVVLIGRLGISMGQNWALMARARMKRFPWAPRESPLNGYTKRNGILDNFLRAQKALPDLLGDIPIRFDRFARFHIRELMYLDTSLREAVANWKSLFAYLHPRKELRPLLGFAVRAAMRAPFIWLGRRFGLHLVFRALKRLAGAAPKDKDERAVMMRAVMMRAAPPAAALQSSGGRGGLLEAAAQAAQRQLHKDIFQVPR